MITSFVAVAEYVSRGGKNTFMTFTSSEPFVNVGLHQEVWLEVDMDFVRRRGMRVVRRELGGGTVVITDGEQDFFLVVNAQEAPAEPSKIYQLYLTPVVDALRSYGINASLRDQDIVVNGKKISGNGAMTRGNAVVIAGNVLMRLDLEVIAGAVRVPSEKFRDKMAKDMSQWLTSLERELGYLPTREDLISRIRKAYENAGFSFEDSSLPRRSWRNGRGWPGRRTRRAGSSTRTTGTRSSGLRDVSRYLLSRCCATLTTRAES